LDSNYVELLKHTCDKIMKI